MNIFKNNNIKAVIFDLDGTLIDSMCVWRRVLPDFLDAHKIEPLPDMIRDVAFMTLTQSSEYVAKSFPQLNMTGAEIMAQWMGDVYEYYSSRIKLKTGAGEFIDKLKEKGIKTAIATACNKKLAEVCLKNNGIEDKIDVITYAEDVGTGKDSPDIYIECLKRLECSIDEAILFEDILVATKSANSIGLKTIVVEEETASEDKDELKKIAYKYIVDFRELI